MQVAFAASVGAFPFKGLGLGCRLYSTNDSISIDFNCLDN